MRTIPSESLAYIQKQYGTEPIFILEVAWSGDTTHRIAYSDQKINGGDYPYPTIIDISDFNTTLCLNGASDSQTTSVTLDDVDGTLKTILNTHDIQKCPCWVYQSFKGLDYNQRFLLFRGEVTSPVNWDEGARTLQFDILNKTTDTEVAFLMEEGDFPNVPEDALGKVWPLVFGTVCNMQAVPVRSPRKGYLATGEGIHDFTISPRICQAHYLQCKSVVIDSQEIANPDYNPTVDPDIPCTQGWYCSGDYGRGYTCVYNDCSINTSETPEPEQPPTITQDTYGPDPTCIEDRFNTICELQDLLDRQRAYEHPTITIKGGEKFPQNEIIRLNIDGAIFQGRFIGGETFYIIDRQHPDYLKTTLIACHAVSTIYNGHYELVHWNSTWVMTADNQTWYVPSGYYGGEVCTEVPRWVSVAVNGAEASQKALDDMPTGNFCWLPAGSEVYLQEEAEMLYIVSLLPGTINNVAAYKKQVTTGRELLMTVPTDLYTVYETDYNGYTVVEIGLEQKLSQIDETWGDDLYVSFTSDVGPNPIDIIDWLLTKYTTLTFDPVSKVDVKTRLTNYPTNFWLKEKMNVLTLIRDIAYQTRCAVYLRDDILYIVYLPEEPTSVKTLTESDILANTFNVPLSDADDLRTKYTVSWRASEAGVISTDNVENKIILKYNVTKYGITPEEVNYYTQNTFSTILKSATFWLIRLANTWKRVSFDTPLTMLELDLFDCITIDVAQFSSTPVKVIITDVQYNNKENTIHFECLTPIRSGETTPYKFFWPADIDAASLFPPTAEEADAGAGYPFIVTPPLGHILRGGDTFLADETTVILSAGDAHPSDLDDTYPTVVCKISDTMDIVEPEPDIQALQLAQKAFQATRSNYIAAPRGTTPSASMGGGGDTCMECGVSCDAFSSVCTWQVTVGFVEPRLRLNCNPPPYGCGESGDGGVCTGIVGSCCYTFGSSEEAEAFRNSKLAEMEAQTVTCDDGSRHPTDITDVGAPQVHYGKSMMQEEPYGGWIHSKEIDLCTNQVIGRGFGAGGSLGSQCRCISAEGLGSLGEETPC